jgi:hypothetical protein
MILYQAPEPSPSVPCPYLPDRHLTYEHFFAGEVRPQELDWLLTQGWRKFGAIISVPHARGAAPAGPYASRCTTSSPAKANAGCCAWGAK